jgi:lactose/L-arabinose transport system substrate-binding protein
MAKKFIMIATVVATLLLLVACNTANREELVIWAWNRNVDILNDAVQRYQETVDPLFKARVESFSQNDIDAKFLTARELDDATLMADIVLLDSNNVRRYYDAWPSLFVDFNKQGVNSNMKSTLVSSTVGLASIDNKLIAMPYGIAPTVVFAYKPLWDQEKLDDILENGWTWQDYIEIGLEIQTLHPNTYMTAYNMRGDDRLYRTMTSQKGEWMMSSDLTVQLSNPNSIAAMTLIKSMHSQGIVGHIDTGDYKGLMKNGQVAAQIHGYFVGGQMKDVAPEQSGEYVILPLPKWDGDSRSDSITGGSFLYVNSSSKGSKYAISFVKWMTLEVDNAIAALQIGGIYPALIPAYESDYFNTTLDPYFSSRRVLYEVSQFTKMALPIYPSKYMSFNYTKLVTAQEKILFLSIPVQTALDEAKTAIEDNAR